MIIRLRTLGDVAVVVDGHDHPGMRTRPVQLALLLYLALERQVNRDQALALLWPESDEEHARQALRTTLYALRQELGDEWLESHRDTLRATAALTADATEMLEAAEGAAPQRAAELYAGAFMAGVRLAESQPLQLWCDQWRARLERLNRRSRRALIDEHVAAGNLELALAEARRWLELDPLEDEAQHRVLELLFRLGRGGDAVHEYEAYRSLLAREGLEPLDQTRALVEEMQPSAGLLPDLPAPRNAAGPSASEPAPVRRGPLRRLRLLVPVGVALAVGAIALVAPRRKPAQPSLDGTRILVLPLANETGDTTLADIGLLTAEWITHSVARMGPLKPVPTLETQQMLQAGLSGEAAARERRAGTLVSGRYFRVNDSLEIHVEITDLQRRELWDALAPVRVAASHPEAGLRELTERVAGSLGVRFIPGTPLPRPSVLAPPNYPAFRALLDASGFVRRGDWAGALPHLDHAVRLDPTFYRAHLFLASALSNLGQHARADSVLDALAPSRDRFSEFERVAFQGERAMLRGDVPAQLAAVQEGARLDPGGTLHYISANIALAAGRPREALALYSNLDPNCPWAPAFLGPWNSLTGAYHLLGLHDRELEAAGQALVSHPLSLPVRFMELRALAALGRPDELRARIAAAAPLAAEAGWDTGVLLARTAAELRAHGQAALAGVVLDSALAWYGRRPPAALSGSSQRVQYADALFAAGRADQAMSIVDQLLREKPADLDLLGREGMLAARLGQHARVRAVAARLEALRGRYQFGAVPYWLAAIAAWSGSEQQALERLRRSFAEGHARGLGLHADPFLEPLWPLPAFALAVSEEH